MLSTRSNFVPQNRLVCRARCDLPPKTAQQRQPANRKRPDPPSAVDMVMTSYVNTGGLGGITCAPGTASDVAPTAVDRLVFESCARQGMV